MTVLNYLGLFAAVAVSSVPSTSTASTPAKVSCADAYKTARVLNREHWYSIGEVSTFDSPKGEYEKTDAYKARIAKETETALRQAKTSAEQFSDGAPVQYRTPIDKYSASYDADKELLKISLPYARTQTIKKFTGSKIYFSMAESEGKPKVEPYYLGVKKVSEDYFGIAFSTKLKTPYNLPGSGSVKMKPEQAMKVRDQLALSVAGHLSIPFKLTENSQRDDFIKKEMQSTTWRYFVMDAPCVAVIDRSTGDVVLDLK